MTFFKESIKPPMLTENPVNESVERDIPIFLAPINSTFSTNFFAIALISAKLLLSESKSNEVALPFAIIADHKSPKFPFLRRYPILRLRPVVSGNDGGTK